MGSIQITSGTATTTNPSYYAAIPNGVTFDASTSMPYAATAAAVSTSITNLPPGDYSIYRVCDTKKCTTASTPGTCSSTSNNPDGFPETAVYCGSANVTTGSSNSFNASGCPAISNCT
ncbi:MAG: hypothetical protein JNJ69_08785 [Leptospiraceae bacterium]|nr:hypothetical protein [Leptospiraceae bacterium]